MGKQSLLPWSGSACRAPQEHMSGQTFSSGPDTQQKCRGRTDGLVRCPGARPLLSQQQQQPSGANTCPASCVHPKALFSWITPRCAACLQHLGLLELPVFLQNCTQCLMSVWTGVGPWPGQGVDKAGLGARELVNSLEQQVGRVRVR